MAGSIFQAYENRLVSVGDESISVHVGGAGPPLLLLHGYPQSHATWIKLAGPLAENFTCVIADLPGYGASSIPKDAPDHQGFSKRRMAALLVAAMASMGYAAFSVMGHDRGARVAYRMALDHPAIIRRVVIIEIIPTSDMWEAFNAEMAMKAYHWSFLAQPFPLPETLISTYIRRSSFLSRMDSAKLGSASHPRCIRSTVIGKLSRADTRSCTRPCNVRRLSRWRIPRQASRSLR
jgi:haloacetate dehalogenase